MVFIPTISTRLRITINTTVPPPQRHKENHGQATSGWIKVSGFVRSTSFFFLRSQATKHPEKTRFKSHSHQFRQTFFMGDWNNQVGCHSRGISRGWIQGINHWTTCDEPPAWNPGCVFIFIVFTWFDYWSELKLNPIFRLWDQRNSLYIKKKT